jgi:hypothetical protein
VQQAVETGVAAPVITLALFQRFLSRQDAPYGFRLLAALRNRFGGHAVRPRGGEPAEPSARRPAGQAGAGAVRPATPEERARPRGLEERDAAAPPAPPKPSAR